MTILMGVLTVLQIASQMLGINSYFLPHSAPPQTLASTNIEAKDTGVGIGRDNRAPITTVTNNYPAAVVQPTPPPQNVFSRRYTDKAVVSSSLSGGNNIITLDGAGTLRLEEDPLSYFSDTFNSVTLLLNSIPIMDRGTSTPASPEVSYTSYFGKYEFNRNLLSNTVMTGGRTFVVTLQKVDAMPAVKIDRVFDWPYTGREYTFGISEK